MSFGSLVKKALPVVGGFLGGPLGATAVSAGLSLFQGNKDQKRANKAYAAQQQIAQRRYNDAEPLRQMALSRLQNQQRPDLTAIFQNPENPFANARARPQLPTVGGLAPQSAAPPNPEPRSAGGFAGFGGILKRQAY